MDSPRQKIKPQHYRIDNCAKNPRALQVVYLGRWAKFYHKINGLLKKSIINNPSCSDLLDNPIKTHLI